jgi:hypothetical protein
MEHIDIDWITSEIQRLQQLREELLAGDLAPSGAWISTYTVTKVYKSGAVYTYEYAKWQATDAIFPRNPKGRGKYAHPTTKYTKHQHIGRVSSSSGLGMEEVTEEAYLLLRNRERLEAIEKVLAGIQALLQP